MCSDILTFVRTPQRTQWKPARQKRRVPLESLFILMLFLGAAGIAGAYFLSPRLVAVRATSVRPTPSITEPASTSTPPKLVEQHPAPTSTESIAPAQKPILPEPTPKPVTLPTPAPTTGEHAVGISVADTLNGLSSAELARELDDMVSLGVTWIRIDVDWSVVQRRDADTYDWSRLDTVVAAAEKRNLHVLAILVYTPPWARSADCTNSNRCPPANPATFAHFTSIAVKRYAPQGLHTWEIWNEENTRGSWMPAANPVQYTALLKAGYVAIKEEDATAAVLSGGLAAFATEDGNMAPLEFFSGLYDAGAGPYFDAVGFHPYSFPVAATYNAPWNAWQQMGNTAPSLRSIMMENGDSAKKIWITEYGAPTGGPSVASAAYDPREHADHVTEERQAALLIDAVADAQKSPWAGPLFWYSYKDLGTSESTTENFYGLLHADRSPKPSYAALKSALSQ